MRARPSIDAPSDKAQKRPFLGRLDASRTETRRSVFDPQKREGTCEDTRAMMDTHARLFFPVGIGGIGGIGGMIKKFNKIKCLRVGDSSGESGESGESMGLHASLRA